MEPPAASSVPVQTQEGDDDDESTYRDNVTAEAMKRYETVYSMTQSQMLCLLFFQLARLSLYLNSFLQNFYFLHRKCLSFASMVTTSQSLQRASSVLTMREVRTLAVLCLLAQVPCQLLQQCTRPLQICLHTLAVDWRTHRVTRSL